jgi:hypothetical protein
MNKLNPVKEYYWNSNFKIQIQFHSISDFNWVPFPPRLLSWLLSSLLNWNQSWNLAFNREHRGGSFVVLQTNKQAIIFEDWQQVSNDKLETNPTMIMLFYTDFAHISSLGNENHDLILLFMQIRISSLMSPESWLALSRSSENYPSTTTPPPISKFCILQYKWPFSLSLSLSAFALCHVVSHLWPVDSLTLGDYQSAYLLLGICCHRALFLFLLVHTLLTLLTPQFAELEVPHWAT